MARRPALSVAAARCITAGDSCPGLVLRQHLLRAASDFTGSNFNFARQRAPRFTSSRFASSSLVALAAARRYLYICEPSTRSELPGESSTCLSSTVIVHHVVHPPSDGTGELST